MKSHILSLFLCISLFSFAGNLRGYEPLDKTNPISFGGNYIVYKGEKIMLGEKTFFIDGRFTNEEVANCSYVFNSVNEALKQLTAGSEAEPMTLYLAPYVYWIDDPDDPAVRRTTTGRAPFGQVVKCEGLRFYGLTDDARNVVLASWRGQTQGSAGNFTMFYFDGDGISSENITFGNYCNVDLEFPLLPALNRARRSSAITQAQLIICNSDKVVARNTRFISRLNLCPFAGARRALFDNCYFESTDDALCSRGVYLNSRFAFYGSKPFYRTDGTGAVFLNCDFDVQISNRQYLTKVGSPVTIVDSRFHSSSKPLYIGWTQDPADDLRCYQYNVSLDGEPLFIGKDKPEATVDMPRKPILEAYRIEHQGKVIYNTYNLLRGDDDWDPMGVKEQIVRIGKETRKDLTRIPTYLTLSPSSATVESGVNSATLTATVKRFGNYACEDEPIRWSTLPGKQDLVSLHNDANPICHVNSINEEDETQQITVTAVTALGLEAASAITVSPKLLEAPAFLSQPRMVTTAKGKLKVDYTLDLAGRADESLITWYRCADAKGSAPVSIIVSRLNRPEYYYTLSDADRGYYIMASVAPKHIRCRPGIPVTVITPQPVTAEDVISGHSYYTDFQSFPTTPQPQLLSGFWTIDGYKPHGLDEYNWEAPTGETWYYGSGMDGMTGTGLAQAKKGARLLYTPIKGNYRDMSVALNVDPGKQAGQGFGSATGQFMEIYIKFDTQSLTGYALRIIRTTKYHNAVDFVLMRYENGIATPISQPVSTVCYRTGCTIELKTEGNKLIVHAETKTQLSGTLPPDVKKSVDLQAEIIPDHWGGTGIQHTGSVGASATMLHWLRIDWK